MVKLAFTFVFTYIVYLVGYGAWTGVIVPAHILSAEQQIFWVVGLNGMIVPIWCFINYLLRDMA